MLKKLFLFLMAIVGTLAMNAQALAPISWTAYGLTFDAPKGILVEEDTEDTFLLNSSRFYISLQSKFSLYRKYLYSIAKKIVLD